MSQRRSPLPLIVAAVVGVLIVVAVRFAVGDSQAIADGPPDPGDCIRLTVVASPDKSALLKSVVEQYNGGGHQVQGQCVHAEVTAKPSGVVTDALAAGWDESTDGPRPDVWSPAASYWAEMAEGAAAEHDQPSYIPADRTSALVQSPLVIAMPRPMAEALGWPDKQVGWADLAALARHPQGWGAEGHPEWGQFKLGKTNPHISTSGLNATVAAFYAATGTSSDLTVGQLDDPETTKLVSDLESSVVHYGDTSVTFLSNMMRAAAKGQGMTYVSALTVEEKSVLYYNEGNPTGDPAKRGTQPKPKIPLVAVYPSDGTFVSDSPWITLDAPWVDPAKKQAAADLLAWLRQPEQQKQFTNAGFRTFDGKPGDAIKPDNGTLPAGAGSVLSHPSPEVLAAIERQWDGLRKPAHVLFIMDVSGSMGEGTGSGTRLELAQRAATSAIDGFHAEDQVGLWAFSTKLGAGGQAWQELVPMSAATSAVPAMKQSIAGLQPSGGTGLYATLRAAKDTMLAGLDPDRINAIVLLTDGKNENPDDNDLNSLLATLQGESQDTNVRVFTVGYSDGADSGTLTQIAEASAGGYYDAQNPATIDQVMVSVLSNF